MDVWALCQIENIWVHMSAPGKLGSWHPQCPAWHHSASEHWFTGSGTVSVTVFVQKAAAAPFLPFSVFHTSKCIWHAAAGGEWSAGGERGFVMHAEAMV